MNTGTDLEIVTAPDDDDALALVSVADQKAHQRLVSTSDNVTTNVRDAVLAAVAYLHGRDGILNRSVLPTTWRLHLPAFPSSAVIELPFPPLTAVSSITYVDSSGTTQTLSSSAYLVRAQAYLGQIERIGTSWPATKTTPRAVTIEFTAGYDPTAVPRHLTRLIKMLAAHYYENREITIADPRDVMSRPVQFAFDHLVTALRVPVSFGGE